MTRPEAHSDLPDLLAKRAELSPARIALEEHSTGRTLNYHELNARAAAAAALMAKQGVKPGDRVAILCRNRIAFFEILFGCAKLGAIMVPLNWRMPAAELDGLIADCEPALLFFDGGGAATIAALTAAPPTICLDDEYEKAVTDGDGDIDMATRLAG